MNASSSFPMLNLPAHMGSDPACGSALTPLSLRFLSRLFGVLAALLLAVLAQTVSAQAVPAQAESARTNAKLLPQKASCFCELSCTSSNGPTMNKSYQGTPRWQVPGGADDNACHNECNALTSQSLQGWLNEANMCKTGNCQMKSHLGTGGEQTYPYSFDNSSKLVCQPKPDGGPCCPSYLTLNNLGAMFDDAGHNQPTPYFMAMTPTAPSFLAFTAAVNAHLALARAGTCGRNAAFIKITYTLYNTNSAIAPTSASVPATLPGGWTAGPSFSATFNGINPPTFSGTAGFNIVVNPNYYVVIASADVLNSASQRIECSDVDSRCFQKQRFGGIHNPVQLVMKAGPGAAAGASAKRVVF